MAKRNFSLFHKLIFANIFYALPAIALIWLMVSAKNENIDFARMELVGDVFQRPLEDVLEGLANLRVTAVQKNTVAPEALTKIDSSFGSLKKVYDENGVTLQFTEEGLAKRKRSHLKMATILAKWNDVKTKITTKINDDSIGAVGGLIGDIRGMITHVGDTSNLILDPDLDSYYLMDVTLAALPQMQDRLQDLVVNFGGVVDKDAKFSPKNRIDLAVYSALFKQSDIDRVTGDFQTVVQEDPNFNGESPTLKTNLDPSIKELSAKTDKLLAMLDKLSGSATSPTNREEFFKTIQEDMDQSFVSWRKGADELDILLQKRIDNMVWDRNKSLLYALISLFAAFFVLFWVALNFNKNMQAILNQLKGTLQETHTASRQLVQLSTDLSQSTNDQASALQETASALEEINSMVETTVQNTDSANRTAETTLVTVGKSETAMNSLMTAMTEIADSNGRIQSLMAENSNKMTHITSIISSIGDKTKVINEIVFQTKLLSFNASVEAARAGEHGKGFAVVAEEVGNLASMSGKASHEITQLLDGSVTEVHKISDQTKIDVDRVLRDGQSRLTAGDALAQECHRSLEAISQEFNVVRENVSGIMRASEEQAKGIREITTAIGRLDSLTGENATMSRQTAEQSEILSKQADHIQKIVMTIEAEVLGNVQGQMPTSEASSDEPQA